MKINRIIELLPKSFKDADLKLARKYYADKDYNKLYNLINVESKQIEQTMTDEPAIMEKLAHLDLLKVEVEYYISLDDVNADIEYYENSFDIND
jgi:hypothetical protein